MTTAHRTLGITGRIAVVALYGIAAFFVANRFGKNAPHPTPSIPTVSEPSQSEIAHLKIDLLASRPVTTWGIRIEGIALAPSATSALSWSGEFAGPLPVDSRLVLAIEPTPTDAETPLAVRLRIQGETAKFDRTFWSDSDLVEAIPLELFHTPNRDTP